MDIPSGAETGIKTDIAFPVTDDGAGGTSAVDLEFDSAGTHLNATATGTGTVILEPVVRSTN